LLLVVVAGAGLAIAGCGGSESLSLEEYIEEFVDAREAFHNARAEVSEDPELLELLGDDEITRDERDLLEGGYEDVLAAVEDFAAALDDIGPPDELEDTHDEYTELLEDYVDTWESGLDDVPDIESPQDLAPVSEEIDELDERELALCEDVLEVAEDEDVDDAGLECAPPELTIEEYFRELEALASASRDAADRVSDDFSELVADVDDVDEALASDLAELVEELQALFAEFSQGLEEISPPAEAADAHADAVNAYADVADALEVTAEDTRDARSIEELEEAFANLEGPGAAADESCFALQALADDNGLVVDLRCTSEEVSAPDSGLDEYFEDIATLADEFDFAGTRTISIGGEAFTATGPLNDEQRAALVQAFTVLRDGADDLRVALLGITPPAEAEQAHQDYVDSAQEASATMTTAVDQLRTAQTGEARDAILDAVLVPSCQSLVELAAENEIDVFLVCEISQ
jgi:hypothetical protein